MITEW
jgi:hypothetical protein